MQITDSTYGKASPRGVLEQAELSSHRSCFGCRDVAYNALGPSDRLDGVQVYANHQAIQRHLGHSHLHPSTCREGKGVRARNRLKRTKFNNIIPTSLMATEQIITCDSHSAKLHSQLCSINLDCCVRESELCFRICNTKQYFRRRRTGAVPGAAHRSRHVLVRSRNRNCRLSCRSLNAARERYLQHVPSCYDWYLE